MLWKVLGRTGVALAAGAALFATAVPANAASYSAFAFSQGGGQPTIYDFIDSATTSLDMTMYELEDTTAVNDLIALKNRGVTVRVVLDRQHQSANSSAYNSLKSAGVGVVWSPSAFVYTHQKTITVDGAKSLILTGNLTSQYYTTSRDYGVFDDDSRDVASIEKVFAADYAATSVTPTDGDHLLWSPTDSRNRLLSVIDNATATLDVEELELGDSTVVDAIVARAKAGVAVRVVLESPSSYSTRSPRSRRRAARSSLLRPQRLLRPRQGDGRRLRPVHPEGRGRFHEHQRQLPRQQPRTGPHPHRHRRGPARGDHRRDHLREGLLERHSGVTARNAPVRCRRSRAFGRAGGGQGVRGAVRE